MSAQVIDLCGQTLCTSDAAYSFVWPGRPRAFICAAHYAWLLSVAKALELDIESLDVEACAQREERSR